MWLHFAVKRLKKNRTSSETGGSIVKTMSLTHLYILNFCLYLQKGA